jgi:hypothetical protein
MIALRYIMVAAIGVLALSVLSIAEEPGNPHGSAASLAKAETPVKAPDANGYIQRWLLLDPISLSISSNAVLKDNFVQQTVKTEYFPNQLAVIPRDGDKVTVGGRELAWHAVDTSTYNVNLYHFAAAFNKPRRNILFWAVTVIDCPREMRDVRLSVGSNSSSIWWLNDKEVIDLYGDRHMAVEDGISRRLTLKQGRNVIRCAVINGPGLSDICAHFIDADEKPITDFTVNLNDAGK